ncbi:hypothetical protein CRUP_003225, partial [Coryphaenoides rupestris]
MSQDFYELLNFPDSPDHQLSSTHDLGATDQGQDDGGGGSSSSSVPASPIPFPLPPASKKSFQKEILRLMMEGIKLSLDTFRVQIGRLLVHTLSPAQPLADRKEALEFEKLKYETEEKTSKLAWEKKMSNTQK